MLGGFGAVTPVDIKESNEFLDKILEMRPNLRLNRVAGEFGISMLVNVSD